MNNGYLNYLVVLVDSITIKEFEREIRLFKEKKKSEEVLFSLIKYMDLQINESEKMQEDENLSEDDLIFIKDLIKMIQSKKQLTLNIIEEYRAKSEKDLEADSTESTPKVVFAKSETGSIICAKQLEKIYDFHDGKYEQVMELLSELFSGSTQNKFNLQKERMLVNDDSVKGIFELKDFQVRIFYMRENEYIVITGIYIKKSASQGFPREATHAIPILLPRRPRP